MICTYIWQEEKIAITLEQVPAIKI